MINSTNVTKARNVGYKVTLLTAMLIVAGCGGGGSEGYFSGNNTNPGTTPGSGTDTGETPVPIAAPDSIRIAQTKANLTTGENDSLDLTFYIVDAKGGIVPNIPVSYEIVDAAKSGAFLSTSSDITADAGGLARTTITLSGGRTDDRLNHDITLRVKAGAITQDIIIPATGTTIKLNSDLNTLTSGLTAHVNALALDGLGKAFVNTPISLFDGDGKLVATGTTGSDGKAVFDVPYSKVIANSAKKLSLYAQIDGLAGIRNQKSNSGLVLSAVESDESFAFTTSNDSIPISTSKLISVKIEANSQSALSGKKVNFATSLGTISNESADIINIRQVNGVWVGEASTQLNSDRAGIATVSASFNAAKIINEYKVTAGAPAVITLQSDAAVLSPGATTQVIAMVKDKDGFPVENALVKFNIVSDTSGGKLSMATATTDAEGQATIVYTAGAVSTLSNSIKIGASANTAVYPVPQYAEGLTLTVSNQSAFITVAQSNEITLDNNAPAYYYKDFSATVVDTAGRPIAKQTISVSLALVNFQKGRYVLEKVGDDLQWVQRVSAICPSKEFPNPVALLSADDKVSATDVTYTTDSEGRFNFRVRYGKNYSSWAELTINAATRVVSKDNLTALSFKLPVLAKDINDAKVSPPNLFSPYGINTICTDYK